MPPYKKMIQQIILKDASTKYCLQLNLVIFSAAFADETRYETQN